MRWGRLVIAAAVLGLIVLLFVVHDTEVAIGLSVFAALWVAGDLMYTRALRHGSRGDRSSSDSSRHSDEHPPGG